MLRNNNNFIVLMPPQWCGVLEWCSGVEWCTGAVEYELASVSGRPKCQSQCNQNERHFQKSGQFDLVYRLRQMRKGKSVLVCCQRRSL